MPKLFLDNQARIASGVRALGVVGLTFLIVHLFLNQTILVPDLSSINPFDEAAHINGGRTLLDGGWPTFADNLLVDLFYALVILPFSRAPLWMVHAARLGRLLLLIMMWVSLIMISREVRPRVASPLFLGLFFVHPLILDLIRFPSDMLFVVFSALSFWQLLNFRRTEETRPVWWSSLFLGLAAHARNDGLVLFPILLGLILIIRLPQRDWWRAILAGAIPFAVLVGGYILVRGAVTGDFDPGTMRRTYVNFEVGHGAVDSGRRDVEGTVAAQLSAREVYGTPEENAYSVFNAIRKAPEVYWQRVLDTLKGLPRLLIRAYGQRFAVPIFLLALRGVLALIQKRDIRTLLIFALWPAHLASGFLITLFRIEHLQFPFFALFGLAAMGLGTLLEADNQGREARWWMAGLLTLSIVTYWTGTLAVTYGTGALLLALLMIELWQRVEIENSTAKIAALMTLLAVGLVLRGEFPNLARKSLSADPKAEAVLYLTEHYEPGSGIAAGSPGVVWAADMNYLGLSSADVPINRGPDEFLEWLRGQGTQAVYVDSTLYGMNPGIWEKLQPKIGDSLERIFVADGGNVQILKFSTP